MVSSRKYRTALVVALIGLAVLVLLLPHLRSDEASSCSGPTDVAAGAIPEESAGYRHEQLVNAAHILRAGKDLGLSCRDQTIGVMTAMGESSLVVLDHGDAAGPDSRGLFQQRDNGAWGSYADRMDPYTSAISFFTALRRIDDRDALEPSIVAHRVQRNADPHHYRRYWAPAQDVVAALTGTSSPR